MLTGPFKLPKVTILTPTKDRPRFLEQCAKYIARQTYPRELLEWVIVDAGNSKVFFESWGRDVILRTAIVAHSGSLGAMRNVGLRVATGELIVHFDDDDWHAPDRIERQVAPFLVKAHLELVCTDDYHVGLFNESPIRGMQSWSWGLEMFSSGGTFMYRKRAWQRRPFVNVMVGEDYEFAKQIRMRNNMSALNLRDSGIFACVRHGNNTCEFDEIVKRRATEEGAEWLRSLMGSLDFEKTSQLSMAQNQRGEPHNEAHQKNE